MRMAVTLRCGVLALLVMAARGHAQTTIAPRFEVGPAVVGGPGLLWGGTAALTLFQNERLQLAVEATALSAIIRPMAVGCYNSLGCSGAPWQPVASQMWVANARATIPLGRQWFSTFSTGFINGQWHHPIYDRRQSYVAGVGVGRRSRSGRRALEGRFLSLGTGHAPTNGVQIGWHYGW